jgi:HK97 family phage prohead protease/HK97 family phage major capsid protein
MTVYSAKLLTNLTCTKENDDGSLTIEGYANTTSKDRAGDVIPKSAWEKPAAMQNYLKNPIILAYHDHSRPVGKMVDYEVTDIGLKIRAVVSKAAGDIYDLVKEGILKTFSVGFRILDASYDSHSDTYYITDVELHEISIVSIPCNQDSTFSVAKSMKSEDFEKFKSNLNKPTGTHIKGNKIMTKEEMQAMLQEMQAASIQAAKDAVLSVEQQKQQEEAARKAKELEAQEREKQIRTAARKEAEDLVAALQKEMKVSTESFQEMVKATNDQIVALKDEIAQVVSSRTPTAATIGKAMRQHQGSLNEKDIDTLVILGVVKGVKPLETAYGSNVIKAVNTSSSIAVTNEGLETVFSTNLIRDIQANLVVAPLFNEIPMTSASLTLPINPGRSKASWVSSAAMGDGSDSSRTGGEVTMNITERTLRTFKLAAKAYLTEETDEDVIISLVPLIRQQLVEAHAAEMDAAFLLGDGVNKPKGLVTHALAANAKHVSTAKADGSVKVTAAQIMEARKKLGLYGVNKKDLVVIISQDAYWDLILDPEWNDVQQVGAENATKLVGEVGNIYGIRVLVSSEFAPAAVNTAYAVLVNTTNFVVPRQRDLTLRSQFDIETDRTAFVATQRVNLEALFLDGSNNAKGVAAVTYAAV